jgi:hypothetical protein
MLILVTVLSLCVTSQAYAWTGEIQGILNLDQRDIVISGSGKWSDQQDLSLLGSAYLPSGRRLVIKIELNEAELGRELSLDNPKYLFNYLEFSPRGSTVLNTQVTSGWINLQESYLGLLEMTFSISINDDGQTRKLNAQTMRLIDPDVSLPDEVVDDPDFDLVIITDDGYQDEGCYSDYSDDEYEDDSGCDSGSSYSESGGYEYYYEDDYEYDDSESEDSEDGCADDDFAAEASTLHRRRMRRRSPPASWHLFLRLLPLLCSTLLVVGWRRRLSSTRS